MLRDGFPIPQYRETSFTFYIPSLTRHFYINFLLLLINLLINRKYVNTEIFDYNYKFIVSIIYIIFITMKKALYNKI